MSAIHSRSHRGIFTIPTIQRIIPHRSGLIIAKLSHDYPLGEASEIITFHKICNAGTFRCANYPLGYDSELIISI